MTEHCCDANGLLDSDQVYTEFLSNTKDHVMVVGMDQGETRHLRFARPGSGIFHYNVVTWPGYLAISGDMGCFVFSRVRDMFEFFRDADGKDRINLSYWSEKCEAEQVHGGRQAFSEARFRRNVLSYLEDVDWDEGSVAEVHEQILSHGVSNGFEAYELVSEFKSSTGKEFHDFWEYRMEDWDYRFVWCLFAIVNAVRKYDAFKDSLKVPAT